MNRHLLLYYPLDDNQFPDQDEIIKTYMKNHCDVVEIAVPVEDPVLDGKTIRESMFRILERVNRKEFFEDVRKLKCSYPELKIQLMAYSSVIKEIGTDRFLKIANDIGVSYVLSPDADRKLNQEMKASPEKRDLETISFSSLSTEKNELDYLTDSEGYIFQRSTDGKTGKSEKLSLELKEKIKAIKKAGIKTPVVVGFGISEPEQVRDAFAMGADGVVIGSALFPHILNKDLDEYLKQFREWYE